jgi:signal transduction histidine kinase
MADDAADEKRKQQAAAEHAQTLAEVNERLVLSALREQKLAEDASRSAEELRESERLRAQYVSLLSHDLLGPLGAARIAGQMMLAADDPAQRKRSYDLLDLNLSRMQQLVRDMLDAGRVRAGHPLILRLEPCDLVAVARKVIHHLPPSDEYRVELSGPETLEGIWSPSELNRALWNLISNALKYGDESAPVVVEIDRKDGRALVCVHNEGDPISPEDQSLLFSPFNRTAAATQFAPGWGLGLTLVRGCAEAHGGTVTLSSSLEKGTTFTLELPFDSRPFQT